MRKGRNGRGWLTAWFLSLPALVIPDQCAKLLAARFLQNRPSVALISGVLELSYLENRGIAFGLFQGGAGFFAVMTLAFLALILYIVLRIPRQRFYRPLFCLLALLTSGALGNLIDRIFRGYVIDYIYFSLIHFPVFNLADIYVVLSVFLLAVLLCTRYREEDFGFLSWKGK
ncbi:MAG: signal peptidase II [Clostridiales bacterium]|nr:signal peptidase II [Clostridiales bacterium]